MSIMNEKSDTSKPIGELVEAYTTASTAFRRRVRTLAKSPTAGKVKTTEQAAFAMVKAALELADTGAFDRFRYALLEADGLAEETKAVAS